MGTGIAKFMAKDPYNPDSIKADLDELLNRMDGVLDWAITPRGEVAVEYDNDLINDEMIEDALSGIGLKLKHIVDMPHFEEEAVRHLLDREEKKVNGRKHA
jgi:hypothetical protein